MDDLPNFFAFGGGNVPASFQWPHEMESLYFHLSFMSCVKKFHTHLSPIILWRCFDFVHMHGDVITIATSFACMPVDYIYIKYYLSGLSYFIQFALTSF